jgi:hypothetical protein
LATATPGPPACIGDCNGNGIVSVDELITLVNIALDLRPIADCPAGNRNGDITITIDELLEAVANALNACPE